MIKKINKNVQSQLIFVVFTLTALLSYHKCVSAVNANSFGNRVIHEESYQPPALQISPAAAIAFSRHQKELGKNDLLNSNLNSNDAVKSESVESILNKRYSHKEEIFGDDSASVDDEKLKEKLRPESEFKSQQSSFNDNQNSASELKAAESKHEIEDKKIVKPSSTDSKTNSDLSSNEVLKKRAQRTEKYNDLKHRPQQQQQQQHQREQANSNKNSISKSSYFDYNDDEDLDQKLRDYRKNKLLEKEILNELDDLYNYDYEVMMMKLLLGQDGEQPQDEELDETQMDTNELGNAISHNSLPNNYDENKMDVKNLNSLFKQGLSDEELIDLLNADFQQQQQQMVKNQEQMNDDEEEPMRLINKPVKILNVKEKLYSESNYNNKIKSESSLNEPNQNAYIDEIFKNFDLNLLPTTKEQIVHSQSIQIEQENQVKSNSNNNKNQINAVNGSPSLAVKSKPGAVDPNLNDKIDQIKQQNDYLFIFVVAGCVVASAVALVAAGVCWYTVHRGPSSLQSDFPTKSNSMFGSAKNSSFKSTNSSGDRRLAQSAQMYHYQHQKQQMIAMEKANNDIKPDNSDNSEGETEEGDYTVYECPGLAPTGEMEVKNPLFKEEYSASTHSIFTNTSMPPPYSAIDDNNQSLEQPKEQKVATTDSVTIPIKENSEQQ